MWCPKCRSEYREGINVCPVCQVHLVETLPAEADEPELPREPELLMVFSDQTELAMAQEVLERSGIPYLLKELGSGEYLRIVTGANMFGTGLYVDRHYTHRALRLLRQFDHAADEPFPEEDLEAAVDAFSLENPEEAAAHADDRPASPEGYRMVWIFLAIFAALALIPLIRSLFYG